MRALIAVITCHKNQIAAEAIRQTWAKTSPYDVRFFFGVGNRPVRFSDEVFLGVPDTYIGLPVKVHGVIDWAHSRGYDYMLKCDDDSYVVPSRIQFSGNHAGLWVPPDNGKPGYIRGGSGYVLSRHSMEILRRSHVSGISEDLWVTETLQRAGVSSENRDTHVCEVRTYGDPFPEIPTPGNDITVSAEYAPQELYKVHKEFLNAERLAEDRMSADEYKKYLMRK